MRRSKIKQYDFNSLKCKSKIVHIFYYVFKLFYIKFRYVVKCRYYQKVGTQMIRVSIYRVNPTLFCTTYSNGKINYYRIDFPPTLELPIKNAKDTNGNTKCWAVVNNRRVDVVFTK